MAIHIPRNLPDPSDDPRGFEHAAIRAIPFYLEKTHGKAFVLFTSSKMIAEAARVLAPWFAERNIALFAQSDGMPRSKMVEAFKADVDSVIFGADSFWQGVDVPGEALSNVIIFKLPFSVPDKPLLEARLEAIRQRGGNPFVEYQVPEAVLKLKQGFGRLIRSRSDSRDRGDPRPPGAEQALRPDLPRLAARLPAGDREPGPGRPVARADSGGFCGTPRDESGGSGRIHRGVADLGRGIEEIRL